MPGDIQRKKQLTFSIHIGFCNCVLQTKYFIIPTYKKTIKFLESRKIEFS